MDSREQWKNLALKELKTDNLSQVQLSYGENRVLDPVYFNLPYSGAPQVIPGFAKSKIIESFVPNENKRLLNSLQEGLDAIVIADLSLEELARLFSNVHPDWIEILVRTMDSEQTEITWRAYYEQQSIDWDRMNLRFIPKDLLTSDANNAVSRLTDLLEASYHALQNQESLYWLIEINDKQLETVAKCRAARILFQNLCTYLKKEASLCLCGNMRTKEDEYGRIRAPYLVLTAAMSGIDYLDISTHSIESDEIRLTRNTSFILAEESKMSEQLDPFLGSYFMEHMTYSFCRWAWEDFVKRI